MALPSPARADPACVLPTAFLPYRTVCVLARSKARLLPGDEDVGKEAARYIRFASAAYGMLMLKVRGRARDSCVGNIQR